jgi:uncharacterized protein (DUF1330 family)
MASAYLIHVDPPSGYGDPDGMARYASNVGAIVESFGGVYHARHKAVQVLEGPLAPEFITLIEFPSMDMLRQFYDSAEYRPWLELRTNAGNGSLVIFEGSRSPDDFDQ